MTDITLCQDVPAGNTKPAGSKYTQNPLYRWFFTLSSEDLTDMNVYNQLFQNCKSFTFQLERGKEGFLHYQGHFSLNTKHRLTEIKNLLGFNTIHLEPLKDYFKAENYCSKDETKVRGPWTEKKAPLKIIETLFPWQQKVIDSLKNENDRLIEWYYDENGGKGKTQLCKYLVYHYNAIPITSGKTSDVAHIISKCIEKKIIIFNYTRQAEEHINYSLLESVKDGLITSGKYDSSFLMFDSPKVIVFANFRPDLTKMSLDRWKIITL